MNRPLMISFRVQNYTFSLLATNIGSTENFAHHPLRPCTKCESDFTGCRFMASDLGHHNSKISQICGCHNGSNKNITKNTMRVSQCNSSKF